MVHGLFDVERGGRQKVQTFGGEGAQGGQGLPCRRESGLEEEWRMDMDVEEEIESRKKLDEQKRKLQKELLEIETLSCLSKECQESLKSNLQLLLQVTLEAFLTLFRQTRECFNF